jgi:hypothetical protein
VIALFGALDVSALIGTAIDAPAGLTTPLARAAGGVAVGGDLGPVRLEGQLTLGERTSDGTPAVRVRTTRYEAAALGGVRARVTGGDRGGFSLDALAGPSLLATRATYEVYDDTSGAWSLAPRATLAAGPAGRIGPVTGALRAQLYLPLDPQWAAYATLGVVLP